MTKTDIEALRGKLLTRGGGMGGHKLTDTDYARLDAVCDNRKVMTSYVWPDPVVRVVGADKLIAKVKAGEGQHD